MAKEDAPKIITLDAVQLQELLGQLEKHLPASLFETVSAMLRTLKWLMELIQKRDTTIRRLQRLIFGVKTEKGSNLLPEKPDDDPSGKSNARKPAKKGHGRNGAKQYPGARRVEVTHATLQPGDLCPQCRTDKARLSRRTPSQIVRIIAQPIIQATLFSLEVLRCNLCGKTFTAAPPPQAGAAKYDDTVGVMIALMRFGAGMPHYRLAKMQQDFGVPLPSATQWELMEASSKPLEPPYKELIRVGAQAALFHNDDTNMRVHDLKRDRTQSGSKRTGIFTTSIISKVGDHHVALYYTGSNHAGENLAGLLEQRAGGLEKPIHMCDALSRNLPKAFDCLLANCLPHGRRYFVDIMEAFPQECHKVINDLALVFKNDAQARNQGLSPSERLALHQQESGPVMDGLKKWMDEQVEQKKVEPNSGLGEAIAYMCRHWEALTLFLRVAGAPLTNNICERALKMAILHRKNSLAYKTENGARVGDLFMSLIQTCRLAGANPYEYLSSVVKNADRVRGDPHQWLPWNYTQSLATAEAGAN